MVKRSGEWFVVDADGNITARLGNVSVYRYKTDSLYEITDETGKLGWIQPDGTTVTPCQWDGSHLCDDGIIAVSLNEKYGYLNMNGETVVPCVYDHGYYSDGYFTLIRDGYLTILDRDGNIMF